MHCVGNSVLLILLEPVHSTKRGESRFGILINPVVFIYVYDPILFTPPFLTQQEHVNLRTMSSNWLYFCFY